MQRTVEQEDRHQPAAPGEGEPDPADRRRVVVQVVPERVADVSRYCEPMGDRWQQQVATYTDSQLEFLVEFLRQGRGSAQAETTALRTNGRPHATRRRGA